MKNAQTFLYDTKTGNIQYIDKTRFIKEFCGLLSQKNNKIIDLQEVKKLNSSTYRDILKKYDKFFLKLSPGIQSTKLNQNIQLILLLDKTTEDFEKYCKKNNLKFGKEVTQLELKDNIDNKKLNYLNYTPKETKEELKMKNKNLVKKVAIASVAALISMPNLMGVSNINSVNQVYAESIGIDYNQTPIWAESGYYSYLGAAPLPSSGWIKDGTKDELGHDNYVNALCFYENLNKLAQWSKENLMYYGIDPDLGIMDPAKIASAENQAHIQYTKNLTRSPKDINPYDKENPLYVQYGGIMTGGQKLFKDGNGWLWVPGEGAVLYKDGQVVQKQSELSKAELELGLKKADNGLYPQYSSYKNQFTGGKWKTKIFWYDANGNLVKETTEDGYITDQGKIDIQ